MTKQPPTVFLLEDDQALRESLVWSLEQAGLDVEAFSAAEELLDALDPDRPGCLVLDLRLGPTDALQVHERLQARGCHQPFIIISGLGTISSAVEAMRRGAIHFLEKPVGRPQLLMCIQQALEEDARRRARRREAQQFQERLDSLTPRERQVMEMVVNGQLTKQIARKLGISTKTVEVHRSHITRKMRVKSVAQLVRLAADHGFPKRCAS